MDVSNKPQLGWDERAGSLSVKVLTALAAIFLGHLSLAADLSAIPKIEKTATFKFLVAAQEFPQASDNSITEIATIPGLFSCSIDSSGMLEARVIRRFWGRTIALKSQSGLELNRPTRVDVVYDGDSEKLGILLDGKLNAELVVPRYHDMNLNVPKSPKLHVYPNIPRAAATNVDLSDPGVKDKNSSTKGGVFTGTMTDFSVTNEASIGENVWEKRALYTLQTLRYRGSLLLLWNPSKVPPPLPREVRLQVSSLSWAPIISKTFTGDEVRKGGEVDISALDAGDYKVLVQASQGEAGFETVIDREFRYTKPDRSVVDVNDSNVIMFDGKPFFPLGIYHSRPKDFKLVADSHLNIVTPDYSDPVYHSVQQTDGYVGEALRQGMKVLMRGYETLVHPSSRWPNPSSYVGNKGIIGWQVDDEPKKFDHLVDRYESGMRADPSHLMVLCQDKLGPELDKAAEACDVLSTDPYTGNRLPALMVAEWTKDAKRAVADRKPVWTIIQTYTFTSNDPSVPGWNDMPSQARLRAESYLALAAGARGILYYSLDDTYFKNEKLKGVHIARDRDYKRAWESYVQVFRELKDRESLWTANYAPEPVLPVSDGIVVSGRAYSHDGALWVLAVNPSAEVSAEVQFEMPGYKLTSVNGELDSKTPRLSANTVKDNLGPFGVGLYCISGAKNEN